MKASPGLPFSSRKSKVKDFFCKPAKQVVLPNSKYISRPTGSCVMLCLWQLTWEGFCRHNAGKGLAEDKHEGQECHHEHVLGRKERGATMWRLKARLFQQVLFQLLILTCANEDNHFILYKNALLCQFVILLQWYWTWCWWNGTICLSWYQGWIKNNYSFPKTCSVILILVQGIVGYFLGFCLELQVGTTNAFLYNIEEKMYNIEKMYN